MTPAEAARRLREIVGRLSRNQPLNHDPQKYFEDRSQIESDLLSVADGLAPARVAPNPARDSAFSPGRIDVAGRSVFVTTRGPRRTSDAIAAARRAFK